MMKFAKVLRAFVIAFLAILIINTSTITLLDKYVFNKEETAETSGAAEPFPDDSDEGLTEELTALFMPEEEPSEETAEEEPEKEPEEIGSFTEHIDKTKAPENMFSVPSLLTPPSADTEKKADTSAQAKAIYNKYYAVLSGMQGSYEGRAASLLSTAKSEYYAAVKAGENRQSAKSRLYSKYFSVLSGLLSECNGAVEGVLAQMTGELNAIGASTAPVGQLRSIYNSAVSSYTAGGY